MEIWIWLVFSGWYVNEESEMSVICLFAAVAGSSVVFYMEATDLPKHDFYDCYMIIVQGN